MSEQPSGGVSQGGSAANAEIKLANTAVSPGAIHGMTVDYTVDMCDMATLILNNVPDFKFSERSNLGDTVEVKLGGKDVFKGEISGIEPCFEAGGKTKVTLRCFSMMHRLTRGKFSKTYEKQTFTDIVNSIAGKYSLTAKFEGTMPTGQFEHIYQHVQTDYDFLLQWAGRVGAEIIANDKEMVVRPK